MKVNLQNIVGSAVERGLLEGYYEITSGRFKGTADEAVECLYNSVMNNLDAYISFEDDEKPGKPKIGFASDAKSTLELQSPESDDDSLTEEQKITLPKLTPRINRINMKNCRTTK